MESNIEWRYMNEKSSLYINALVFSWNDSLSNVHGESVISNDSKVVLLIMWIYSLAWIDC